MRVAWDCPGVHEEPEKVTLARAEARKAALELLRDYKARHGHPMRRWEYAVTRSSYPPPLLPCKGQDGAFEDVLDEYAVVEAGAILSPIAHHFKISAYVLPPQWPSLASLSLSARLERTLTCSTSRSVRRDKFP